MTTEKILDRVRKMLALANDNAATEHERDTALQMAYRLLAKYNLTIVDADNHSNKEDDPRGNYLQQGFSFGFAKYVNMYIAEMFFCEYYVGVKVNGTQCAHHFIGKESNATTAMYMATYVVGSILKEGRKNYGSNTCSETRSFALGATARLRERIRRMIVDQGKQQEQDQATSGCRELALLDVYTSERAANEKLLPSTLKYNKARQSKVNAGAYQQGSAYGNKINLNMQIESTSKSNPLIR